MEGTDRRWRGAIADGGERSQVEGSDHWCQSGGGERSQAEGSGLRSRGAIAGGGERRGAIAGGAESERSQVEGSDRRWRGAIAGGGSDRRWRGAITGGDELLQVEGSDRRRRGVIAGARGGGLSQALLGGTGPGTVSRLCIVAMLAGPGPASLLGYDRLFQAVSHPSLRA